MGTEYIGFTECEAAIGMRHRNQKAVVTGGSQGIGWAIADKLGKEFTLDGGRLAKLSGLDFEDVE